MLERRKDKQKEKKNRLKNKIIKIKNKIMGPVQQKNPTAII